MNMATKEVIERLVDRRWFTSKEYHIVADSENPNFIDRIESVSLDSFNAFKQSKIGGRIVRLSEWLSRTCF